MQRERGVRICEIKSSTDTKVSAQQGGRCSRHQSRGPPAAMVRQAVPLQPMEVHSEADIHVQRRENPMLEQEDA